MHEMYFVFSVWNESFFLQCMKCTFTLQCLKCTLSSHCLKCETWWSAAPYLHLDRWWLQGSAGEVHSHGDEHFKVIFQWSLYLYLHLNLVGICWWSTWGLFNDHSKVIVSAFCTIQCWWVSEMHLLGFPPDLKVGKWVGEPVWDALVGVTEGSVNTKIHPFWQRHWCSLSSKILATIGWVNSQEEQTPSVQTTFIAVGVKWSLFE